MSDELSARVHAAPTRIQRQRTKGWRMPANAVYVGRPTKWGNPYPVECFGGHDGAVAMFRTYALWPDNEGASELRAEAAVELRGKDLACWCRLVDENGNKVPCHADVLLEIANR